MASIGTLNKDVRKLQNQIRCLSCKNCIELTGCEGDQVPTWDEVLQQWICGDGAGATHDEVTLNADQPTQDSANLVGQELQLVPATSTTYGVVKLEDLFAQFERVANYSALPDPTLHSGEYYHVEASQGTWWLPGSAGGTYYSKGFYYSNGVSWEFAGEVPYQALQAAVDAGIILDQFVSPGTLANATTVSHPGHTHVKADITDFAHTHTTADITDIANTKLEQIGFGIRGNGAVITTGYKGRHRVPFSGTITGWTIIESSETPITSSIVVDVKLGTYANYDTTPTFASIAGTEKPTITTSEKGQDLTLTTWTTSVTEGDFLEFTVDSVTDAEEVMLFIHISKT